MKLIFAMAASVASASFANVPYGSIDHLTEGKPESLSDYARDDTGKKQRNCRKQLSNDSIGACQLFHNCWFKASRPGSAKNCPNTCDTLRAYYDGFCESDNIKLKRRARYYSINEDGQLCDTFKGNNKCIDVNNAVAPSSGSGEEQRFLWDTPTKCERYLQIGEVKISSNYELEFDYLMHEDGPYTLDRSGRWVMDRAILNIGKMWDRRLSDYGGVKKFHYESFPGIRFVGNPHLGIEQLRIQNYNADPADEPCGGSSRGYYYGIPTKYDWTPGTWGHFKLRVFWTRYGYYAKVWLNGEHRTEYDPEKEEYSKSHSDHISSAYLNKANKPHKGSKTAGYAMMCDPTASADTDKLHPIYLGNGNFDSTNGYIKNIVYRTVNCDDARKAHELKHHDNAFTCEFDE